MPVIDQQQQAAERQAPLYAPPVRNEPADAANPQDVSKTDPEIEMVHHGQDVLVVEQEEPFDVANPRSMTTTAIIMNPKQLAEGDGLEKMWHYWKRLKGCYRRW